VAAKKIYQFKVTLRGIRPPIWRRFQVNSDITFYKLHRIIQEVMGWADYHLHLFDMDGLIVTDAETLAEVWGEGINERQRIDEFLGREGQKLRYQYDFGDSWEHDLLLEKILPVESGVHYPRCIKGKRACPPEDCGGIWGYMDIIDAMANENHPEREEYLDWLGEKIDPEEFDLEDINRELARL